mgnify:CR=1 FL=1
MKVKLAHFLPIASSLYTHLLTAIDHLAMLKATNQQVDAEIVGAFLSLKMSEWNPTIKGKSIMDPKTKAAAVNLMSEGDQK